MRLIVTGGGTGGHIYPALALARHVRSHDERADLLYVGTEQGLEKDIVPREGFQFASIEASGLRRKLSVDNVRTVVKTLRGVRQAKRLIRQFKPDIVVGTGGYVCGPMIYAARRLGVPTMILEPDALPGLTNRLLSRFSDVVAVCFPEATKWFSKSKRLVISGNPRGSEVCHVSPEAIEKARQTYGCTSDVKTVVIVGGSRGARPINDAALAMLSRVAAQAQFRLIFVTGTVHYDHVRQQAERLGLASSKYIRIDPFIYDMPAMLHAADLFVSRAGATFISEYTALGIASILIPSPYVTNNHQYHNARWLGDRGAAILLEEKDLTGSSLYARITSLVNEPERIASMRAKSKELGLPDAAHTLYKTMTQLIHTSRSGTI